MTPETLSLPTPTHSTSSSPLNSNAVPVPKDRDRDRDRDPKDRGDASDSKNSPETKGWLYKWTNYIKGYQKRWFVLANGLLSYYRNQAEMAHTCRGTISLHGAHIHTEDSCNFIVSNGGGTQTFHLRASSEVERQRWVTALELAKAKAIQRMESEDDESIMGGDNDGDINNEIDKAELNNVIKTLGSKLEDLQTCHDLIVKHGLALQRSLNELESSFNSQNPDSKLRLQHHPHGHGHHGHPSPNDEHGIKVKAVNERSTLFKITSNAMINASAEFIELCHGHGRKWQKILSNERENRQRLEDMVEQLAKQHSHLENSIRKEIAEHHESTEIANGSQDLASVSEQRSVSGGRARSPTSGTASEDDDLFEDARDDNEIVSYIPVPPTHRRTSSEESQAFKSESSVQDEDVTDQSDDENNRDKKETFKVVQQKTTSKSSTAVDSPIKQQNSNSRNNNIGSNPSSDQSVISDLNSSKRSSSRIRRNRIPDKPNISFSLWSIMKNCIGKDLSRIPIPVNFSEPLSMLQRISEDLEYADILAKAANCTDHCEQLAYVAAFTVSAFSTTAIRTGKPFNPLLGETFEIDRSDDLGFRLISEQVSHHPPMIAMHAECSQGKWKTWQEFTMRSKFKGKYLEVEPLGISHLVFPNSGNHYTWRKVKTIVHNIVLGKLWIDNVGEMEVINHRTGDKCHLKFEPYSYFGGVAKKVHGTVMNGDEEKVEWVFNGTWDSKFEGAKVIGESKTSGGKRGPTSLEVGPSRTLWKVNVPDTASEKYYNFSKYACELNEEEDGVSPTDSRLRPDQRFMELGQWDDANTEKVRLEEKQRSVRRKREAESEQAAVDGVAHAEGQHQPTWFKKEVDEENGGKLIFVYKGGYWESKVNQDWSECPDIF